MTLTHMHMETDLEKAKDGRWVLLIEPDVGRGNYKDGPTWDDNHIPPVVVAKWVTWDDGKDGAWSHLYAAGQGEGFYIEGAKGFVELSDLGLVDAPNYTVEEFDSYIDVATDGTAELVHADGSREPAPEGWNKSGSGLRATRLLESIAQLDAGQGTERDLSEWQDAPIPDHVEDTPEALLDHMTKEQE